MFKSINPKTVPFTSSCILGFIDPHVENILSLNQVQENVAALSCGFNPLNGDDTFPESIPCLFWPLTFTP